MTDKEKRETLEQLAIWLDGWGCRTRIEALRTIAADYDDTPADAEWISKREWSDCLRFFMFSANGVTLEFWHTPTTMLIVDDDGDRACIATNPTRAQVIALERAAGGK